MSLPCRAGCAACCIAPSISPCEALPAGKAAGVPCPHLDEALRCRLFGGPERPRTCIGLQPQAEMCGDDREQALATITRWERLTSP